MLVYLDCTTTLWWHTAAMLHTIQACRTTLTQRKLRQYENFCSTDVLLVSRRRRVDVVWLELCEKWPLCATIHVVGAEIV